MSEVGETLPCSTREYFALVIDARCFANSAQGPVPPASAGAFVQDRALGSLCLAVVHFVGTYLGTSGLAYMASSWRRRWTLSLPTAECSNTAPCAPQWQ